MFPLQQPQGLKVAGGAMNASQHMQVIDIDPECLLSRCSGLNKRTKRRCATPIGQRLQRNTRAKYLPMCASHREQQIHAGWCQAQKVDGTICRKLFRWTPPYFQLCATHREYVHRNAPCYFLKLPTELRQEIFKYLLPTRMIDSLIIYQSKDTHNLLGTGTAGGSLRTVFPTPLLCLYLGFNREVYGEVKDFFYGTVTFAINVSRDGVMLCGRRILGRRGPDGSHYHSGDQQAMEESDRFIRNFAWTKVRKYSVNVAVEQVVPGLRGGRIRARDWDEEVELYDIRDFVGVVVSGVLAKAHRLCSLQVRLDLKMFDWSPELVLINTKLLVGPFERLRCVRLPRLLGVFNAHEPSDLYGQRHRPCNNVNNRCITPTSPDLLPILGPGMPAFDSLAIDWQRRLALEAPSKILSKSPMTKLFTEFRSFHNRLAQILPDIPNQQGRNNLLHRARVAREHEDITTFRALRAELVQYWHNYLREQERLQAEVNAALHRMVEADTLPCEEQYMPAADRSKHQRRHNFIDLT